MKTHDTKNIYVIIIAILFVLIIIAVLFVLVPSKAALTYYLDSVNGDDTYSGTLSSQPWKTLARASEHIFAPGESLLLKSGLRFIGTLVLQGGGTASEPVLIGRYSEGAMPAIDGKGAMAAITVQNMDFCIIQDLEITNQTQVRGPHYGIRVNATGGGPVYGPTLRRLWIHHVSGEDERGGGSGIRISAGLGPQGQPTWYVDTVIEHNHLHDLPFNGIFFSGWKMRGRNPDGTLTTPSTGLYIYGNLLYDIAGDGICIINTQGAIIEHNELHRGSIGQLRGAKTPSAGIWPHSSDDTVMRYNRVEGLRGGLDGQAFDVDINCRRTLVEKNLSRNNGTGFILLCSAAQAGPTTDTVIRQNMSLNDAVDPNGAVLTIVGAVEDTIFSNNVFILTHPGKRLFLRAADWTSVGTWPDHFMWRKNMIVTAGQLGWSKKQSTHLVLDGNLFDGCFPCMPHDANGFYGDFGLLKKPVYVSLDVAVAKDSAALSLGFEPFNLENASLPHDSPWLSDRDAAVLKNPTVSGK